jgi:hypothetical protein
MAQKLFGAASMPHSHNQWRAMATTSLQKRLRELNCQMQEMQTTTDSLRRKKKSEAKKSQEKLQSEKQHEVIMLMLLVHAEADPSVLGQYKKRKLSAWQTKKQDDIVDTVINKFAGMTSESNQAMMDTQGDKKKATAHRLSTKFWREYKLHAWIEQQNTTKAIAPVGSLVAETGDSLQCFANGKVKSAHRKHQKQWLRRFRRRWNISIGAFAVRENVSPKEAQNKVLCIPHTVTKKGHDASHLFVAVELQHGTRNEATTWSQFWGPCVQFLTNLQPTNGHYFVAKIATV